MSLHLCTASGKCGAQSESDRGLHCKSNHSGGASQCLLRENNCHLANIWIIVILQMQIIAIFQMQIIVILQIQIIVILQMQVIVILQIQIIVIVQMQLAGPTLSADKAMPSLLVEEQQKWPEKRRRCLPLTDDGLQCLFTNTMQFFLWQMMVCNALFTNAMHGMHGYWLPEIIERIEKNNHTKMSDSEGSVWGQAMGLHVAGYLNVSCSWTSPLLGRLARLPLTMKHQTIKCWSSGRLRTAEAKWLSSTMKPLVEFCFCTLWNQELSLDLTTFQISKTWRHFSNNFHYQRSLWWTFMFHVCVSWSQE